MINEIEELFKWAEKIKENTDKDNTPVADEEICAGLLLMIRADFKDFRKQTDQKYPTSEKFWTELEKEIEEIKEKHESINK